MIVLNFGTTVEPKLTYISVCIGGNVSYNVFFKNTNIYKDKDLENGYINYYNSFTYLSNDLLVKPASDDGDDSDGSPNYDSYMYTDIITHSGTLREIKATRTPINFTHRHSGVHPSTVSNGCPVLLNTYGGDYITLTSENGDDIHSLIPCSNKSLIFVNNLIPGCKYTYLVYKNSTLSTSGTFLTYGNIRLITMLGVQNIRDIGGKSVNGISRIKYGKIFRGGQLLPKYYNNETGGKYNWTKTRRYISGDPSSNTIVPGGATDNDVAEFKRLKVGLDIDLRDPNTSASGVEKLKSGNYPFFDATTDGIAYYSINTASGSGVKSYASIFEDTGVKQFKLFATKLIEYLPTKSVYVHCQLGKDRTGTFLAILQILLGADVDGVIKDYELTSLWGLNSCTRLNFNATFTSVTSDVYNKVFNTFVGTGANQITTSLLDTLKTLLVEGQSNPTPGYSEFATKAYAVSSSRLELNYNTNYYWSFALRAVLKGDIVRFTTSKVCGGWFIEDSDNLLSQLDGTTNTITFDKRTSISAASATYEDTGVSEYVATQNGYVLVAAYKATGASMNLTVILSTPSSLVDPTEVNIQVAGWSPDGASSAGTLTSYSYLGSSYENWSHYEINVTAGTTVECRYYGTLASFYAESSTGMVPIMKRSTSKITGGWTEAAYVYAASKNASDGNVFVSVKRGTVSGVGTAKHIIYIRNTGKLTISVKRKPTGASYAYPVNTSSSDSLKFQIINNGLSIYGPVVNTGISS